MADYSGDDGHIAPCCSANLWLIRRIRRLRMRIIQHMRIPVFPVAIPWTLR
jgi:hypothetical protein